MIVRLTIVGAISSELLAGAQVMQAIAGKWIRPRMISGQLVIGAIGKRMIAGGCSRRAMLQMIVGGIRIRMIVGERN